MKTLKNLRSRFERFCYKNRNHGIPNLMLYIAVGTAIVYLMSEITGNYTLFSILYFDRNLILRGQFWRLFTYPLTYGVGSSNLLLVAISLMVYYSLGRVMENVWGTLKFNLFYLTGILLMDIYCMIFGGYASVTYLNLSLFLGYATMFPNAQFLLFFIIPIKAWFFALFDLALVLLDLFTAPFPSNFFSVISIANYLLFFGKDVLNIIPMSWRLKMGRLIRRNPGKAATRQQPKVISFPQANRHGTAAAPKNPYTHRCTICGRTDISDPDLEFRYCSRCNGYYCYCEDHINNHSHIQ